MSSGLSDQKVNSVFAKTGGRCWYCWSPLIRKEQWEENAVESKGDDRLLYPDGIMVHFAREQLGENNPLFHLLKKQWEENAIGYEISEYHLTKEASDHLFEVDHVIPRCKGGTNDIENLVPCCARCNRIKGGKPIFNIECGG